MTEYTDAEIDRSQALIGAVLGEEPAEPPMSVEVLDTGALTLVGGGTIADVFATRAVMDGIVAEIDARARAEAKDADLSKASGRDKVRSAAAKVAKYKRAIDAAGKSLGDDHRKTLAVINAERNRVEATLQALQDEVRAPLTRWEVEEAQRVAALETRLATLEPNLTPPFFACSSEAIEAEIERIRLILIDDSWQEMTADAGKAKDRSITDLTDMLAAARDREAIEAENARLRAEAAAREAAEKKAAAEKAAAERRAAEEKAEADRQARITREREEAAARAAEAAKQAAEREAQEKVDAAQRAAREAEERAERAAQAERDRIAEQQRKAAEEAARREQNKRIRTRVRNEIVSAIRLALTTAGPNDAVWDVVADRLMDGKVPHCKVEF